MFPYFILVLLLIRGFTLPGAFVGISAYLKPKMSQMLRITLWKDAGTQVFFSYGIGFGGISALGAYNKFNHNVIRDSILTCIVNGGTSILAGFAVFSTLGHMAHELNVSVDDVVKVGPGLAFVVYPEALQLIHPYPQFWAVCFFSMLCLLGLNSQVRNY